MEGEGERWGREGSLSQRPMCSMTSEQQWPQHGGNSADEPPAPTGGEADVSVPQRGCRCASEQAGVLWWWDQEDTEDLLDLGTGDWRGHR